MKNKKYYFKNKGLFIEKNNNLYWPFEKNFICILLSNISYIQTKQKNVFQSYMLPITIFFIVGIFFTEIFDDSYEIDKVTLLFLLFLISLQGFGPVLGHFFSTSFKKNGLIYTDIIIETSGKKRIVLTGFNEDEKNVFLEDFFKEI